MTAPRALLGFLVHQAQPGTRCMALVLRCAFRSYPSLCEMAVDWIDWHFHETFSEFPCWLGPCCWQHRR